MAEGSRNSRGSLEKSLKSQRQGLYRHDIGVYSYVAESLGITVNLIAGGSSNMSSCFLDLHGHDPTHPTPTKISPSCAVPADVVAVLQVEDGLGTCNASRNSTATWLEHAFLQGSNGCLHISKLTGLSTPTFLSLVKSIHVLCLLGFRQKF